MVNQKLKQRALHRAKIIRGQMDGLINKQSLIKAVGLGIEACKSIHNVQVKALLDKYNNQGESE